MNGFTGEYERQLDDKFRVAFPPSFKRKLEPVCYLGKGDNRSIAVYDQEAFDQTAAEYQQRSRPEQISFFSSVTDVRLDGQGRVMLPPKLREWAGLGEKGPVVLVGMWSRIEIWHPDRLAAQVSLGDATVEGV